MPVPNGEVLSGCYRESSSLKGGLKDGCSLLLLLLIGICDQYTLYRMYLSRNLNYRSIIIGILDWFGQEATRKDSNNKNKKVTK